MYGIAASASFLFKLKGANFKISALQGPVFACLLAGGSRFQRPLLAFLDNPNDTTTGTIILKPQTKLKFNRVA